MYKEDLALKTYNGWYDINPTKPNCPGYDTKQSDGEVPVMQKFWVMQNTPLLRSFPDPLLSRVRAPDRVLCMLQKELNRGFLCLLFFAFKLRIYAKLNCSK